MGFTCRRRDWERKSVSRNHCSAGGIFITIFLPKTVCCFSPLWNFLLELLSRFVFSPTLAEKNLHGWRGGKGGHRVPESVPPPPQRKMGCALSGPGVTKESTFSEEKRGSFLEGGLDLSEETECGETPEQLSLSESRKALIQESWKILHKDIARVGIIVFIRLFETHPECKDVFFLFRDIDDLQQLKTSKELQAHGLRVMSFIEKSVARLDQEDKLEHLAFELGRSHFRYKAPPKYYEYVGAQFIQAVQPILKEAWTPEVEKAWESLFKYLAATMRRGFYTEEKTAGASKSLSSRKAGAESTPNKI